MWQREVKLIDIQVKVRHKKDNMENPSMLFQFRTQLQSWAEKICGQCGNVTKLIRRSSRVRVQ